MPFTLSRSINAQVVTDDGLILSSHTETVDLTYEVTAIDLASGVAFYKVTSAPGMGSSSNYIPFTYSGSGNPIEEAETELKAIKSEV